MNASPPTPGATAEAWVARVCSLLEQEQPFFAYDLCQRALRAHPDDAALSLLAILALLRGRSLGAARSAWAALEPALREEDTPRTEALRAELARRLWEAEGRPEDLEDARARYAALFERHHRPFDGIRAALLSWRADAPDIARAIATRIAEDYAGAPADETPILRFWRLIDLGHARLLSRDEDGALAAYRAAATGWHGGFEPVVDALRTLQAFRSAGLEPPSEVTRWLVPPTVVIFGGQPIDVPGLDEPLFPPGREHAVRAALTAELDAIDARVGYSSAACGADLLFIEAMRARGAEVHIVLPCATDDFVAARVAYAGPAWVARFEDALAHATSVTWATQERFLGHTMLLRYANHITTGMGWLRAEQLLSRPHLLAVWDYRAGDAPGSPADFIDHWPDITTLHLVELDDLDPGDEGPPCAPGAPAFRTVAPEREIRAMLFADVVHYSQLGEEHLSAFLVLLDKIRERFEQTGEPIALVEAWGDALYVVMEGARAALRIAFALRSAFRDLDHAALGLPLQLNVRIGLHAGPVFRGVHPLTARVIYSGSQVNRAARIEPITMPGEVYGSREFVALLTAEENAARHEAAFRRQAWAPWYRAEYLGVIDLPKQHGTQTIYHLLPEDAP